jgi:hypothetical protein
MYNSSKSYVKLSKAARKILDDFDEKTMLLHNSDDNKKKLFDAIIANVATQKTIGSKHTRLSVFRGLLRKYFDMSDEDMEPIDRTDDEKQAYFEHNRRGFNNQHEDIVTHNLLKNIIRDPICYLMVTSGRRIGELLDNEVQFNDGKVYIKLNKKKDSDTLYRIHILGSLAKWTAIYHNCRSANKKRSSIVVINEVNTRLRLLLPISFYKTSSHICRAIYIRYIYKFKTDKSTLPQIINKYLHHESPAASIYYNHVILADDVVL